jgi:hypothetical protein
MGQNVGWLQDSEDNSCALNGISKTDVPSVNEQIKLIRIIRNDEETTDEAILRALQYYVRNLPFSSAGI